MRSFYCVLTVKEFHFDVTTALTFSRSFVSLTGTVYSQIREITESHFNAKCFQMQFFHMFRSVLRIKYKNSLSIVLHIHNYDCVWNLKLKLSILNQNKARLKFLIIKFLLSQSNWWIIKISKILTMMQVTFLCLGSYLYFHLNR